jgi:hypothetical protein
VQVLPETTYPVRRFNVQVPDVRSFQKRYEALVPDLPQPQVHDLVEKGAPWSAMEDLINEVAPYDFLIYFRNDVTPVMRTAGDSAECIAYLMGNHVVAETMFRHDPRAMLYAPLHTLIWGDPFGNAWFTVDQPSSQFGSLGSDEVLKVGKDLDRKLARLLEALDAPIPALVDH